MRADYQIYVSHIDDVTGLEIECRYTLKFFDDHRKIYREARVDKENAFMEKTEIKVGDLPPGVKAKVRRRNNRINDTLKND